MLCYGENAIKYTFKEEKIFYISVVSCSLFKLVLQIIDIKWHFLVKSKK